jgi:hypothetical protein
MASENTTAEPTFVDLPEGPVPAGKITYGGFLEMVNKIPEETYPEETPGYVIFLSDTHITWLPEDVFEQVYEGAGSQTFH